MRGFGPRALTPHEGKDWLMHAWRLMWRHPCLFVAVALFAPAGTAFLLVLPIWHWWLPPTSGWPALLATVCCYGLPLSLTVVLACGLARAANRKRFPAPHQLFNWTACKALLKAGLFLFIVLLQGYLAIYLLRDLLLPVNPVMSGGEPSAFGVASTVLGTQFSIVGGLLLVLQVLLATFVPPLQLFHELPLALCWRHSVLALLLNPWLLPAQGLIGLLLLILPFFEMLSVPVQVLALPLPVYGGALLYVAWNDVFQGGIEEEEILEVHDQWRADVSNGQPVSHRFCAGPDSSHHPER